VSENYAVADAGLKTMGMDHGNPEIPGAQVLFCSDEHVTFVAGRADGDAKTSPIDWESGTRVRVGDRIRMIPAHVDPTIAYHERLFVVEDDRVVDEWAVDLRGW
jgi:D-serine deaminase-like pyridoxal phosphate-dependent protein